MEREIVEKDLRFHELFGYIPATFCIEVKTIMFNEFQEAARTIKEKLIKANSSNDEAVHSQLSCYVAEIDAELDVVIDNLLQYFYSNYIPDINIPINDFNHINVIECKGATDRVKELKKKLLATDQLNRLLVQQIDHYQKEVNRFQLMLSTIKQQKQELESLQKIKDSLLRLRIDSDTVLV